jgi:hypothetical protein
VSILNDKEEPTVLDLKATISLDKTTSFEELEQPDTLTTGDIKLTHTKYSWQSIDYRYGNSKQYDTAKKTFIESNDLGDLYMSVSKAEDNWEIRQYRLDTLDGESTMYQDIVTGLSDGDEVSLSPDGKTASYGTYSGGCGLGKSYTVVTKDPSNLKEVGKDAGGKSMYVFYGTDGTDTGDPLFTKFYEESKGFYQDRADYPKSAGELAKKYPILLIRNQSKTLTAVFLTEYAPVGGCAKPVVYLYPTAPTQVNVTVDADVTISEPAYNKGWTAFAQPNGKLTVNGKAYDSLFWEGYGNGIYPDLSQRGVVVKQGELQTTLVQQLTSLGLNQKERNDFLEFWQPRLPNDPYVKLSWLGTSDMNQLANLKVTPKPDTTIRIFLDAEGLSAPKLLQPQTLTAPARKGFTVVEWGGLIRGKLQ